MILVARRETCSTGRKLPDANEVPTLAETSAISRQKQVRCLETHDGKTAFTVHCYTHIALSCDIWLSIGSDGQWQRQCFPYECIITRAGRIQDDDSTDDCALALAGDQDRAFYISAGPRNGALCHISRLFSDCAASAHSFVLGDRCSRVLWAEMIQRRVP